MRRLTLAVLGCLAALALTAAAHAEEQSVYLVNQSAEVTDAQLHAALPAFQQAVDLDFAPVWKSSAILKVSGSPPAGAWTITLSDNVDCLWCAGYHDQRDGVPYAMVFPNIESGWTVTLTHELFEMLADPMTAYPRAVHTRNGWYMVEVADPVEADRYAYTIGDVAISDFVEPSWYAGGRRPFDFARHVKRQRQILQDGYQLVWRSGGWTELYR